MMHKWVQIVEAILEISRMELRRHAQRQKKASSLEFFKVYGVNAILGFGLGVGIVLLALTLWGRGQVGKIFSAETQPSQRVNQTAKDEKASPQDKVNETVESFNSSRFTVLLIGMDNRPEETSLCNTDSLLVASIDQSNERLTFLSIPRDTQVDLPGVDIQKINAIARVKNGFSATQKYVETMIGYPIDGYVATNFNGFKSIIDSLGGITLNVEKNMHYDTGDSQDRYIDLKKEPSVLQEARLFNMPVSAMMKWEIFQEQLASRQLSKPFLRKRLNLKICRSFLLPSPKCISQFRRI